MTPIEQVFSIFKDFFQLIINLCRTNTDKLHPKIVKVASDQLSKVSVRVRPYREHHDLNIDGFFVVKLQTLMYGLVSL